MNLKTIINKYYKYGSKNYIPTYRLTGGLHPALINKLSININEHIKIKNFRLKSYNYLYYLKSPDWIFVDTPDIMYDNIIYYSIPLITNIESILNQLQILNFNTLNTSIDIIFDSISIYKTIIPFLYKFGIIFMSLFQGFSKYLSLILKYLGTIISYKDNFFATLNSIIFSEGSFCYIPHDIKCEFNLTTYFRTNTENFAQFERTLLIANYNSSVCYLEGCTAPVYKETQLHVAIVELILKYNSYIKYITIQNWYKGNIIGEGGLYNFTTKRGLCHTYATLEWLQVEVGSYMTWKYPSTILKGNFSKGEFYSISFISNYQKADTGGKFKHIGNFSSSRILSKSISLNNSINIYRGLVEIQRNSFGSLNKTECDSLLIGNTALTVTIPYTKSYNFSSNIQQEASISKLDENYIYFLMQRGLTINQAIALLVNGFCSTIYYKIPIDIASEIPYLVMTKTYNLLI